MATVIGRDRGDAAAGWGAPVPIGTSGTWNLPDRAGKSYTCGWPR
jgi:hypothetical protein